MEYTKDITLGVKEGQVRKKTKKEKNNKILEKLNQHRFVFTVSLAIISFIILDLVLINNFISLLTRL